MSKGVKCPISSSAGLILANTQAPGDVLMMTCAVRDLSQQIPSHRLAVSTYAGDIWQNNPRITQTVRGYTGQNNGYTQLKAGYSTSIKASAQRIGHFSTGFCQDLSEKLQSRIRLSDMRPDLYLSPAELDPEQNPAGKSGDYWVVMDGGKNDFTAKIWDHGYWQTVVDRMVKDTRVVQVGSKSQGHRHIPLKGAQVLLGNTTLRQLIQVIKHSRGVICGVTCGMHFAAALNKPCVVIAGGREPWWWEAYTPENWKANVPDTPVPGDFVGHVFLDTLGQLPCCRLKGCWRSGIGEKTVKARNCQCLRRGPTQIQPQCLQLVTPELVLAGVDHYERGGKDPSPAHVAPATLLPGLWTLPLGSGGSSPVSRAPVVPARAAVTRARAQKQAIKQRVSVLLRPTRRVFGPKPHRGLMRRTFTRPKPDVQTDDAPVSAPEHVPAVSENLGRLTICALVYGNYPELAKKCLGGLYDTVDKSCFELRLGMNEVSEATREYVNRAILPMGNVKLFDSVKNVYKYPLMRRMFYEQPLETEWTMWFDDDSYVQNPNWLPKLVSFVKEHPADMYGKRYYFSLKPGQIDWIKAASWYTGRAQALKGKTPVAYFMTGGWWLIQTKALQRLNWPDPRLGHNGGDVMLGEACYQQHLVLQQYYEGVIISGSGRRGASHKHPGV